MFRRYVDLPREVHLLCLGVLINRSGTFVMPLMSLYLADRLGLGRTFATLAIGVFGLGAIAGALIGGQVADRFGRKTAMMIALFGSAAVMLTFVHLTAPAAILAAVFILPCVGDMYRPAAQAFIADVVPPERRPDAFALNFITVNLGAAIGPLIGGMLAEHSFNWVFYGDAITTLACGALLATTLPESLHTVRSAADLSPVPTPGVGAAVAHILRDHVFLLFCVALFMVAAVYMQAFSTLPLFLKDIGVGIRPYTALIAFNGALIVLLQTAVTSIVTRYDRGVIMSLAAFLTAIGYGLKVYCALEWQFAICVFIWTTGEMMWAALVGPIVAELAPANLRGRYMAVMMIAFSGAHVVAAPVGGYILEHHGGAQLWATAFVVAMLAGVGFFAIRRKIAHKPAIA